jgi:diguanylate cyclase (GGDEF)-like protein
MDAVRWDAARADSVPTSVTGPVQRRTGWEPAALVEPATWDDLVHPEDRERVRAERLEIVDGVARSYTYRIRTADRGHRWVQETAWIGHDRKGRAAGVRGLHLDVDQAVRDHTAVQRFDRLLEALPFGTLVAELRDPGDPSSLTIINANPIMVRFLPVSLSPEGAQPLDQVLGDPRVRVTGGGELLHRLAAVAQGLAGFDVRLEIENRVLGDTRFVQMRTMPLPGTCVGLVFDDRTASERAERVLAHRATHDVLTGLANRTELLARTSIMIRDRGERPVTMLVVDLDRFKEVNDAFGHDCGDDVLRQVAQRLLSAAPEGSTVARLGGDEFAVVLPVGSNSADGVGVAARLAELLSEPVAVGSWFQLEVMASTGIASVPDHAATVEELLSRADRAMYAAKGTSSGTYTTYSDGLETSSTRTVQLLGDLRRALTTDELQLHFQPVVRADGAVVGFEGLLRWRHPEFGIVMPGEFIELVELGSLSGAIARTVIRQGVEHAKRCAEITEAAGSTATISVSINLTPRNLADPEVVDALLDRVREARLPRGALMIELTARQLLEEKVVDPDLLRTLREAGIRIAVDNFGEGAASLRLLHQVEIDELKIHRTLVAELVRGDASLVRSIVEFAHSLDMLVVAEGVEEDSVRSRLVDLGCDRLQGFGIGRPVPPAQALAELKPPEDEVVRLKPALRLPRFMDSQRPPMSAPLVEPPVGMPRFSLGG